MQDQMKKTGDKEKPRIPQGVCAAEKGVYCPGDSLFSVLNAGNSEVYLYRTPAVCKGSRVNDHSAVFLAECSRYGIFALALIESAVNASAVL